MNRREKMKKHFVGVLIILGLGAFSWAQGTKEPFDVKKSQEELEIMRGILGTTLSFVQDKSQSQPSVWRYSNLSAFYLAGQGAVFMIPTSAFRAIGPVISWGIEQQMSDAADQIAKASMVLQQLYAPAAASPQAPPSPSSPPAPPPAPQVNREELRRKAEESLAKAKKTREELEARREKSLQSLAEIKPYLIEALANYGDSLTTVKPGEFISLVLTTDDFDGLGGRQRTRFEVISAQKSWVTDYKAGRLSLDNFKQKVLQYIE
jgi:hypothetical protein